MVMTNIRRNICRHKGKMLLNVGIAAIMIFFIHVYMGNLESLESQLERLSNVLSVSGRICNLNGSQTVGLEIEGQVLEGVRKSPYVKGAAYSMQLAGAEGEFPKEEWRSHLDLPIQAVNTMDGIAGIEDGSVQLADGVQEGFLEGDKPYILIERNTLVQRGWNVGDKVPLTIYYYGGSSLGETKWEYLMVEEFTIAGTMQIAGNADFAAFMNGAVPYGWAESKLKEQGCPYFADSLSFELRSGEDINSFKKEMKALKLMEAISTEKLDLAGRTLVLDDATYIQAASQIRKNIQTLQTYLPLLIALVIGAGYTVSYLMAQSRKNEYAIMRMLGRSKKDSFLQFTGELLTVECFGGIVGTVAAMLVLSISKWRALVILAAFLACYFCGTAAALKVLSRRPLITALAQKE